jgi:hypothetical protein
LNYSHERLSLSLFPARIFWQHVADVTFQFPLQFNDSPIVCLARLLPLALFQIVQGNICQADSTDFPSGGQLRDPGHTAFQRRIFQREAKAFAASSSAGS